MKSSGKSPPTIYIMQASCFVGKPHCHFDRSVPKGREVEKSMQKQNPSRAGSRDFSTRPAEGGLDPVQGFALRLAQNDLDKSGNSFQQRITIT